MSDDAGGSGPGERASWPLEGQVPASRGAVVTTVPRHVVISRNFEGRSGAAERGKDGRRLKHF
jgi:hypothetical protein